MAAYGRAGEHMTYYEIDPEMVASPRILTLFTYLRDSQADVDDASSGTDACGLLLDRRTATT